MDGTFRLRQQDDLAKDDEYGQASDEPQQFPNNSENERRRHQRARCFQRRRSAEPKRVAQLLIQYHVDNLRWTPNPKLNFQFALNVNHQSNYNLSENNYLGTYTFSSLEEYLAGRALTFRQTSGNPLAQTNILDANISVNMTYRMRPTMSYRSGAQYTIQTHHKDYNNISPTTQFQIQLKQRHTISVGARLTYPTVGFRTYQYEQLIRGDGTTRQFTTVISDTTYPDRSRRAIGTTTGVGKFAPDSGIRILYRPTPSMRRYRSPKRSRKAGG